MKKAICIKLLLVLSINSLIIPLVHAGKNHFKNNYKQNKESNCNYYTKKQRIENVKHQKKLEKTRENKKINALIKRLQNKDDSLETTTKIIKKIEQAKKISYYKLMKIVKASMKAYTINKVIDAIIRNNGVFAASCMGECITKDNEYGCNYIGQFTPDQGCYEISNPDFDPLTILLEKTNNKLDENKELLGSLDDFLHDLKDMNPETLMVVLFVLEAGLAILIPTVCFICNCCIMQYQNERVISKQEKCKKEIVANQNSLSKNQKKLRKEIQELKKLINRNATIITNTSTDNDSTDELETLSDKSLTTNSSSEFYSSSDY